MSLTSFNRSLKPFNMHLVHGKKTAKIQILSDTDGLRTWQREVDLYSSDPVVCAGTQLKMVLLMGIKDKLVQHLISLDANASLQIFVMCCRSYEATRTTASAFHASPSQHTFRRGSTMRKDLTYFLLVLSPPVWSHSVLCWQYLSQLWPQGSLGQDH